MVHAIDEHGCRVFRGCGHDDFFRAGLDVLARELIGEEEACGLYHNVCADLVPFEVRGIHFGGEAYLVAVYDEEVAFYLDVTVEAAVNRVVFQHIGQIVGVEKVVDADNLNVIGEVLHGSAEHHTADAAESINT